MCRGGVRDCGLSRWLLWCVRPSATASCEKRPIGSRIAHTSVERLGSVSGGSRERDVGRVRGASGSQTELVQSVNEPCGLSPHGDNHQGQ